MTPVTGRQLHNLRKKHGWTQADAARAVCVAVRTWARWEAGDRRVPEWAPKLFLCEVKARKTR